MNKFLIILIFIVISGSFNSFAATTWTGNTSTDWGDPANWSGTAPSSSTSGINFTISSSPTINSLPIKIT